jgi:hypothetical protein
MSVLKRLSYSSKRNQQFCKKVEVSKHSLNATNFQGTDSDSHICDSESQWEMKIPVLPKISAKKEIKSARKKFRKIKERIKWT